MTIDQLKQDAAEWFAQKGLTLNDIRMIQAYMQNCYMRGALDELTDQMNKPLRPRIRPAQITL